MSKKDPTNSETGFGNGTGQPSPCSGRSSDPLDMPDVPGHEMKKNARVWRTYVEATNKQDKEFVEQHSGSLDVLLIFAGLFSAISTAFLIESQGDLKPDPADSTAQTLLVVSQTLIAIANGQPAPTPQKETMDPPPFRPSSIAVTVNVLWIVSLSLSVFVSLFAMLAKDWCYRFTLHRTGDAYDQARRRQKRWNAIEKWKMEGVLRYLPALLHLALILFVIGLCVRLWETNFTVAVPVIALSGLVILVYLTITIVSTVDPSCPYNTPFTDTWISLALLVIICVAVTVIGACVVLALIAVEIALIALVLALVIASPALAVALMVVTVFLCLLFLFVSACLPRRWLKKMFLEVEQSKDSLDSSMSPGPEYFGWLDRCTLLASWLSIRCRPWLDWTPRLSWLPKVLKLDRAKSAVTDVWSWSFPSHKPLYNFSDIRGADIPMDSINGQIISWLLHGSEDVLGIEIGLQAISGASHNPPLTDRAKEEAFKVVEVQRPLLKHLVRYQSRSRSAATLSTALMYGRCYAVLVNGSDQKYPWNRWEHPAAPINLGAVEFMQDYLGLLNIYRQTKRDDWDDVVIAATVVSMRFCHWHGSLDLLLASKQDTPSAIAISILQMHVDSNDHKLPDSQLYELVKSTAHYLIGQWPREPAENSRNPLPMLLARIFLSARSDLPVVASAAATALASAMAAMSSYPGEDQSNTKRADPLLELLDISFELAQIPRGSTEPRAVDDVDSREKQAIALLAHHHQLAEQALGMDSEDSPTMAGIDTLFVFGFLGLLPKIDFGGLSKPDMDELSKGFEQIVGGLYPSGSGGSSPSNIYGLRGTYSFSHHVTFTTCRYLLQNTEYTDFPREGPGDEQIISLFLSPQLKSIGPDTRLYITALIALCRSNSDGIRGACQDIINAQPFPANPLRLVRLFDGNNLLDVFYRSLVSACNAPTHHSSRPLLALRHFRLLVVGIMLSAGDSLRARRAALQPLWDQFNEPVQHTPNIPALSDRDLMSHVKGKLVDMRSGLNSTMRLVGDFLNTTPELTDGQDWHKELQGLKDEYGRETPKESEEVQVGTKPTEASEPSTSGVGVSENK